MGFRDFIRSLFGTERRPPSELHDGERKGNVIDGGARFNLDEWIGNQKATYGLREGLSKELDRGASLFNSELLGISGELLDELIYQRPRMLPTDFWGGDLGWRSAKRKRRWEYLLTRNGIMPSNTNQGMLIRFNIDASEWVPHPYAPPHWATSNYTAFSQYIAPSEEAFKVCLQWRAENSIALTGRLADRIRRFPVRIGASYRVYHHSDHAEVAFYLLRSGTDVLRVKTVWKGETQLWQLVKRMFPDASREYSPPWLWGQRIDVFIPSLQVALEYHGQQHYDSVKYFGGKKGFLNAKERDKRKSQACKEAGVVLIVWKYNEPINDSYQLKKLFKAYGIERPGR